MVFAALAAAVYGILAFYLYKATAEISILNAYLWNGGLIIVSISIDKIIHEVLQSKDLVITKKNYIFTRYLYMDSFVSFKTAIYLFYIFILIVSQMLIFVPDLVNEDFGDFIITIEYGILLVIAFDTLISNIFKDVDRVNRISAKFKKYLSENQDL